MPRFSVVVPAFDAERFVGEALNAVASQTCTDYEIIVVDDGSRDRTASVVMQWAKAHGGISLQLVRQENSGIGAARNAGIAKAQGDYVAFLDADDLWSEHKIEVVSAFLSGHPQIDLVCHDERLEEEGRHPTLLVHGPYTTYEDLLFRGNTLSTSAVTVRRELMNALGGFSTDLRFNGVEDYECWLRTAKAGSRIAYLHQVLGMYRVHGGGITSQADVHCANLINVLRHHYAQWPSQTGRSRYRVRKRESDALRTSAREFMRRGEREKAKEFLAMALKKDPLSWKGWVLTMINAWG